MDRFLAALQFLTRISVKPKLEVKPEVFGRSMLYFPLVGLIIGGILAALAWFGGRLFTPLIAGVIILAAEVLVTGGLHLDGFMDTMDGLYSGRSKERILEIMKDSRVGAHSVVILVLFFLFKLALIMELLKHGHIYPFLLMPMLGRLAQVLIAVTFPYVREQGIGKLFKDYIGPGELWPGLIFTLLASFLILSFKGLIGALAAIAFALWQGRRITAKLGGLTGDIYGAVCEETELFYLFVSYIIYTFL